MQRASFNRTVGILFLGPWLRGPWNGALSNRKPSWVVLVVLLIEHGEWGRGTGIAVRNERIACWNSKGSNVEIRSNSRKTTTRINLLGSLLAISEWRVRDDWCWRIVVSWRLYDCYNNVNPSYNWMMVEEVQFPVSRTSKYQLCRIEKAQVGQSLGEGATGVWCVNELHRRSVTRAKSITTCCILALQASWCLPNNNLLFLIVLIEFCWKWFIFHPFLRMIPPRERHYTRRCPVLPQCGLKYQWEIGATQWIFEIRHQLIENLQLSGQIELPEPTCRISTKLCGSRSW